MCLNTRKFDRKVKALLKVSILTLREKHSAITFKIKNVYTKAYSAC
jgi:hypothetical protein